MSQKTFTFNFHQTAKMPKNFLLNSKNCACIVKYYGTHTTYGYVPDPLDYAITAIQSLINSGDDSELIASENFNGQNSLLVPIEQSRNKVEYGLTEVTIKVINRIDITVYDFTEIDEEEIITTPPLIDEVLQIPSQFNILKPINNSTWQPIDILDVIDEGV